MPKDSPMLRLKIDHGIEKKKTRLAMNQIIRETVPGGNHLLDAMEQQDWLVRELKGENAYGWQTAQQVLDLLVEARDEIGEGLLQPYRDAMR